MYERHGKAYDQQRVKFLPEKDWLDRFVDLVPAPGSVLDLGCGAGDPVCGCLLDSGLQVTGIDFAESMLALARQRYPAATFLNGDLRELQLDGPFQGAISWDGTFHLAVDEQARLIATLSAALVADAPLLMTVGPEDGEAIGQVNGEAVYHASLSPDGYRGVLDRHGFDCVDYLAEDPVCDRSVLLARRRKASAPAI